MGALYPGKAASNISVCTAPNAKQLKLTSFLYSSAKHSDKQEIAALLELYADNPANLEVPLTPPTLPILTTCGFSAVF